MAKPRGYIERVLFVDVETSGLSFGDNPVGSPLDGETFQIVSIGLVVASAQTLKAIDELYIEIKWNGTSTWSPGAQKVHGLSMAYLDEHGVEEEEAVALIAGLILKHWGPDSPVCLGGHNVATFDRLFLKDLLNRHGIFVKFGSKTIDTNSIGFATTQDHNSDDLFATFGLTSRDPNQHNALQDAKYALEVVRLVRLLWQKRIGVGSQP